jgi:serine phosphatase RsbU (regulator of sigma subunit)
MKKSFFIKYLFLFFLTQGYFYLPAQNKYTIDSLQNLINSTTNDTTKILALISSSNQYKDNNLENALKFAQQALELATKLNYKKKIDFSQNSLGELYLMKGDYGQALTYFFKALKNAENLKDDLEIARSNNGVGQIFYHQKDYSPALEYFNKSLITFRKLNYKKGVLKNYNDIGIIFTIQKRYNEALQDYDSLLKISEAIGNKQGISVCYANISVVYYQMNKMNMAIEYTIKAIKMDEEAETLDNKSLLGSYSNLGALYIQNKQLENAAIALQKAMTYVKNANDKVLVKGLYDNFSELYQKNNNYQKAFEYAQLASVFQDSIYNESNSRQTNELTARYEAENKEQLISNLERDNVLSDEQLKRENNFKTYLTIFCVLVAVFAFLLFRGNIQKRKTNHALSLTYKEIEEKNKDITDSINYSKRIQEACLPPRELKHQLFNDIFILFKPKDIVSGDFYWYTEKNGKKLIACCDCTGHGVPGALMSMIGNNILNEIVNEKGITTPNEILNHLHKEIRKALKQDEQSINKDGMDIALVTFNNETEIEYAGAQRPLWIFSDTEPEVRNFDKKIINNNLQANNNSLILTEIKANKFSIGGSQTETERKFTNHKISLKKGDSLYIFSDGFADQFGGAEGKRFMSKRFKDLLLTNYQKPMFEQENKLVETIETWKGTNEQVDDILVIGIRI